MTMQTLSESVTGGIRERQIVVGEATGALWTADDAVGAAPLLLIGHAERQNRTKPDVIALGHAYARAGYTVVAIDAPCHGGRHRTSRHWELIDDMAVRAAVGDMGTAADLFHAEIAPQGVAEWHAALDALQQLDEVDAAGPVGFLGVALGSLIGIPFLAADDRVTAAVLGLLRRDSVDESATRVRIPVEFRLQWDDELVPRDAALTLYDDLGSAEKALHANAGGHLDVPAHETESALRFFARHLGANPSPRFERLGVESLGSLQ